MRDSSLPVKIVSGVSVVVAPDEIDVSNATDLRMALLEAAGRRNRALVVDMSRTQFCDSTGLNVLVRAHQRAQADGTQLLLVTSAPAVVRIFTVTGIARMIPCLPTLDEALAKAQDVTAKPRLPGTS